jgi:hypothetical protein
LHLLFADTFVVILTPAEMNNEVTVLVGAVNGRVWGILAVGIDDSLRDESQFGQHRCVPLHDMILIIAVQG